MARTRERVHAAALELFAEHGLARTTIPAIADRAEVHKTTIYRNWDDVGSIVTEVLEAASFVPPERSDLEIRDQLVVMFSGLARSLQTTPWASLLPGLIEAAAHHENLRDFHRDLTVRRSQAVMSAVQVAQNAGQMEPSIDGRDVLEAIAGPLYFRVLMTKEPVGAADVELLVDRALRWVGAT